MNNSSNSVFKFISVMSAGAFLIYFAHPAAEGVRQSLMLCVSTVVPSMLPFLTLTSYVTCSGMLSSMGKPFDKISSLIFKLPGESFCIFLMSMVGGFPVGLKMTAEAFSNRTVSQNQAKRMAVFCIGGGPAFIINTVGLFMAGNKRTGVIFFASLVLSSFATGVVSRFFSKGQDIAACKSIGDHTDEPLIQAVEISVKTITGICGWIILFGALKSVVMSFPIGQGLKIWLNMFCEVTNGCAVSVREYPMPFTAFVLGFCGLCVHCQVLPFIRKIGLPYKVFVCVRLLNGAAAAAFSHLLFSIFHCETAVFSNGADIIPVAWSVSFPASAAFILTLSIIILDLAQKEKV